MTTMDELIEEILVEYEPRFIPEDVQGRLQRPLRPQRPFIDLDDQVPPPVGLPADEWVEILTDAKDEFEVDGAAADPKFCSQLRCNFGPTHLARVKSLLTSSCFSGPRRHTRPRDELQYNDTYPRSCAIRGLHINCRSSGQSWRLAQQRKTEIGLEARNPFHSRRFRLQVLIQMAHPSEAH